MLPLFEGEWPVADACRMVDRSFSVVSTIVLAVLVVVLGYLALPGDHLLLVLLVCALAILAEALGVLPDRRRQHTDTQD